MDNHPFAFSAAKLFQLCPTLCNPIDGSPPGSPVPGILQARTLEWVAIPFSNAWKWKWSCSVVSDSVQPHGLQPTRLLRPWDFPGKSAGVGCHCLLYYLSFSDFFFACLLFMTLVINIQTPQDLVRHLIPAGLSLLPSPSSRKQLLNLPSVPFLSPWPHVRSILPSSDTWFLWSLCLT